MKNEHSSLRFSHLITLPFLLVLTKFTSLRLAFGFICLSIFSSSLGYVVFEELTHSGISGVFVGMVVLLRMLLWFERDDAEETEKTKEKTKTEKSEKTKNTPNVFHMLYVTFFSLIMLVLFGVFVALRILFIVLLIAVFYSTCGFVGVLIGSVMNVPVLGAIAFLILGYVMECLATLFLKKLKTVNIP